MELQPFFCREFSSRSISSFRPSASGWLHGPPFLRVCTSRTAVQHIGSSLSSGSRYSIFTLPEADLRLIQQQQQQKSKAPLTVLAYTQDNTVRLDQGVPGLVNNEILQTSGSIQLKANFPNAAQRLWPGELVNARLLLGTRRLQVLASGRNSAGCTPPSWWCHRLRKKLAHAFVMPRGWARNPQVPVR
jgi:hypothetical protein